MTDRISELIPCGVCPCCKVALASERAKQAEPVASANYIQPVPDHCDRITWRGRYFHLPLATLPADDEAVRLLREARDKLIAYRDATKNEYHGGPLLVNLMPAIDAYLAKKGKL